MGSGDEVARSRRFLAMRVPWLPCIGLLATFAVAQEPPLPAGMEFAPLPAAVPGHPKQVELGRLLFFDPVLSASGTIACATCHQPQRGWTDGRPTAVGEGPLQRNTPTILNVAFNTGGAMFWDNRAQGLEAQALHPLRARDEMRGSAHGERRAVDFAVQRVRQIPEYQRRFREVFDAEKDVDATRVAQALAAFERSLVTPETAFDRFMRGDRTALSAAQQRGMKAFTQAGCQHCHGGPMLSDFKLHVIGAPGERQAFRTPTLRNLTHTAPYMHNGRLRTLDDVLVFYDLLMDEVSETLEGGDDAAHPPLDSLLKPINVNPDDFEDLKAFLESLSAERYDQGIPEKVPSGLQMGK